MYIYTLHIYIIQEKSSINIFLKIIFAADFINLYQLYQYLQFCLKYIKSSKIQRRLQLLREKIVVTKEKNNFF